MKGEGHILRKGDGKARGRRIVEERRGGEAVMGRGGGGVAIDWRVRGGGERIHTRLGIGSITVDGVAGRGGKRGSREGGVGTELIELESRKGCGRRRLTVVFGSASHSYFQEAQGEQINRDRESRSTGTGRTCSGALQRSSIL